MKHLAAMVFIILVAIVPVGTFAMSHGQSATTESNQKKHQQGGHAALSADDLMYILGEESSNGVRGMAHLNDVRETMAKMHLAMTHHFMIAFVDEKTGEQIETGKAALKIKGPDGETSEPVELVGMQGHFGADIKLDQPGQYQFMVGTVLPDGVKRAFDFRYDLE